MPTTAPPTSTAEPTPTPSATRSKTETATEGWSGLGDPYFPDLGNGGYDVQHYDLRLSYEPDTRFLSGEATISGVSTQPLSAFNMELTGFDITSLQVDGVDASFEREDSELTIVPGSLIAQQTEFTVTISYQGVPEPIDGIGWIALEDGSTVLSEPNGASTWYPVNDYPTDKATYTFSITVPKGYEVIANGLLSDMQETEDQSTWTYQASEPMASYLATVNIGDFSFQEDRSANGVEIRNAFTLEENDSQESVAEIAPEIFSPTADMIDYFSTIFGPYPFEVYGAVVIDSNGTQGLHGIALETQTLSVFTSDWVEPGLASVSVIAHELAHQWFGDSVTPETWQDIWLNEGFATYAEWLWFEHTGIMSADEQARSRYDQLSQSAEYPPPGDPGAENLFAGSVYFRGAYTLQALRLTVGDETFFNILRAWTSTYAYSNASTADFIQLSEEISGQDLSDLFQSWLYEVEFPEYPPAT